MRAHKYFISQFFCTECGNEGIPLPRPESKKRESGHLKTLYCNYCKKETNFVEVRDHSSYNSLDFRVEFINHNFINGKRQMSYPALCQKLYMESIRKEKEKKEEKEKENV